MEKQCSICREVKDLSEFNQHKSKKDGHQSWCRLCQAEKSKEHYRNNRQMYADKRDKHRRKITDGYVEYKQTLKCEKCQEDRWYVLDFHHTDPSQKDINIGEAVNRGWMMERLMEEIEKCVVLCKNCHAEHHYLEKL